MWDSLSVNVLSTQPNLTCLEPNNQKCGQRQNRNRKRCSPNAALQMTALSLPDTLDEELLWDPDRLSGGWIVAKSADFAEWKAAFAELGRSSIEQKENPSFEPAAEAYVCACRNQVPLDAVLRSNVGTRRTSLSRKSAQIDLTWSHLVVFGHIGLC